MKYLHLEIPKSIFAAGFIICLLSALGLFYSPATQAFFEIGLDIGLLGIIVGLIMFVWDR